MKRKFLLLFLTLSINNLHASNEIASISENSPLLSPTGHIDIPEIVGSFSRIHLSETQLQKITSCVTLEALRGSVSSYQKTPGVMLGGEGLIPPRPEYLTLQYLEGLNKANWEKWIKTYGTTESLNYLKAVDSAAEYARMYKTAWGNLRKQMIEEPCWLYRKFHSDTMKNRRDFFNEVSRRVEFVELQSQNKSLRTEIAVLQTENKNLDQTLRNEIEELKKQVVEFRTENETLKENEVSRRVEFVKLQSQNESLRTQIAKLQDKKADMKQKLQQEKTRAYELQVAKFKEEIEALKQSLAEKREREEIPTVQKIIPQELASQIKELQHQFEELKASITSVNPELAVKIQALSEKVDAMDEESEDLKKRLEEEIAKRSTLEQSLAEKKQSEEIPTVQESILQELTPQIEELQHQFEELKASIASANAELTKRIQALSEKVEAMDLEGIRADVEILKTTKVGVNFINRFSYLVQSLIIAKKRESEESRYISIEEWKQIVQEQKAKVEANSK